MRRAKFCNEAVNFPLGKWRRFRFNGHVKTFRDDTPKVKVAARNAVVSPELIVILALVVLLVGAIGGL